jgi:exonuclease VII large subunit
MRSFEKMLKDDHINFATDRSIKELFTLAHEEVDANDLFDYMVMSVDDKEANEFVNAKKLSEFLQKFSELQHKTYGPKSLLKEYEAQLEQQRLEEERREREEQERQMILAAQQAQAEQEQRKADRLAAGLAFLLEERVDGKGLKIQELSNGISRINQFLGKNKGYEITDSDKDAVGEWLKILPKPTKKAEKKEYEEFASKSWQQISSLVGPETAKQWFEEIVEQ